MKLRWIFLVFIISFNFSYANKLEKFYKFLDESPVVKLKIKFIQNQLGNNYESNGDFYILGLEKYFYDSADIEIHADSNYVMTKNYLNEQVIYNDLDLGQLNLFDILSGNKKHINFSVENHSLVKFIFSIPAMGYHGYFLFESNSRFLKKIFLQIGLNQSILINVAEIEALEDYTPKIDLEDFELIDLRG